MYNTRNVNKDRTVWQEALEGIVVFLALSAFDNEVSDLLHRFKLDPKLGELPAFKRLVGFLTTQEVIPWPLPDMEEYVRHPVLAVPEWFALFQKRIIQHVSFGGGRRTGWAAACTLPARACPLCCSWPA